MKRTSRPILQGLLSIFFIIAITVFNSCINQQNETIHDDTFVAEENSLEEIIRSLDSYMPDNLVQIDGYEISETLNQNLTLFDYIYVNYINSFDLDRFYVLPTYNASLFYRGTSKISINHIDEYDDGEEFIMPFDYHFEKEGKIILVNNLQDDREAYGFSYDALGRLKNMAHRDIAIQLTEQRGSRIDFYDPKEYSEQITNIYKGGVLDIQVMNMNLCSKKRTWEYLRNPSTEDSMIFLKVSEKQQSGDICIPNGMIFGIQDGEIQHICYSGGFGIYHNLFRFVHGTNSVTIYQYHIQKNDEGERAYPLDKKFEVIFNSDGLIERVKSHHSMNGTFKGRVRVYSYQYIYRNEQLESYSIFENNTGNEEAINDPEEYQRIHTYSIR